VCGCREKEGQRERERERERERDLIEKKDLAKRHLYLCLISSFRLTQMCISSKQTRVSRPLFSSALSLSLPLDLYPPSSLSSQQQTPPRAVPFISVPQSIRSDPFRNIPFAALLDLLPPFSLSLLSQHTPSRLNVRCVLQGS